MVIDVVVAPFNAVEADLDARIAVLDMAENGPVTGDRLIDWVGVYNVYYTCPASYGEYVITRSQSPSMITFLQSLALGDGAVDTATSGSSGFQEAGLVLPNQAHDNSSPIHPDTPGHFTCSTP